MKTVVVFCSIGLLALLGGCIGIPYPEPYGGGYGAVPPPVQYAPPQQYGCRYPYIPVWNGCAMSAYSSYGGPLYPVFQPGLWLDFNFGHHRGRGHHRGDSRRR